MPGDRILIDSRGKAVSVPDADVAGALAAGYHLEGDQEHASRIGTEAVSNQIGGVQGTIGAGLTGFLRGATLGLSDVASDVSGDQQISADLAHEHGAASTIGQIVGGLAPTALTGGASAEWSIGKTIAHGAIEGAGQNAGNYISQVALGDKELSAEGFVGAMGEGAMFGGGAAGALKIGAGALSKARGLFKARGAAESGITAAGDVAAQDFGPSLELADQPVGRARTMAPEAAGYSEMPASRLFHGDVTAQAEQATSEASDAMAAHFGDTDEALMIGRRRIKQAQDIEDLRIGKRGGQTEWSAKMDRIDAQGPPKAAFDPEAGMREMERIHAESIGPEPGPLHDAAGVTRPTETSLVAGAGQDIESQLGRMKSKIDGGHDLEMLNAENKASRLDPATASIAEKRAALEEAHQQVLQMLDREHMAPYAGAKTIDDKIGLAMKGLEGLRGPSVADQIVGDATRGIDTAGAKSINEQIGDAIGRRTSKPDADLKEAIAKLSSYEQKSADYAAALGDEAPPGMQAHAKDYNASVAEQHAAVAQQTSVGAGQLDGAMADSVASGQGGAKAARILEGIKNASTAVQVLHSMGITGIPDPASLPVIGPLLGLYLKARAMMMVGKRMGLKIPATAESVIASKSSAHIARITAAMDKVLDAGSKGLTAAAPKAGGTAAILGHKLFDDGTPPTSLHTDSLAERRDELVRAQRPGAVAAMVQDRVRASDPALVDEIAKATQRKLDYLYSVVPKPPVMPGMLKGAVASWSAAPGMVTSFSRSVQACEDPASVLETLASGAPVTFEAAEALRNVYPRLFQKAQQQILIKAQDTERPLTYAKRVQLSVLFQVPLDGTMAPAYQAALAAGYKAPQGQPQGSAPPMSAMTADVTLGARTSTGLDQRGAR